MSAGFIEADGQIAIAATFVAEPVETSLNFWLAELGTPQRIAFAPYNQVFQQLLDPSSLLAANQNGVNVILARPVDWGQTQSNAGSGADARVEMERNTRDFARALIGAAARSAAIHLVFLCPVSTDSAADPAFRQMEELIVSELRATPRVHVVTSQALAATYPVAEYYDAQADKLAHVPYSTLFFTALGSIIARKIHALRNSGYKVIVLDGDQTLWDGVCGEDGPLGIRIGAQRKVLQEFMVEQHNAGMLLCLCSANNEEDVAEVFSCHPEMPLKREHFAGSRINWRPKSENIKALAEELQLGLDSFIFIDDDDVACAEVQTHCPQVLTLQLPRQTDTIPRFLRHLWVFDRLTITQEARQRTALYAQHAQRERIRQVSPTLQDFLTSLDLKIQILPLAAEHLTRVAELTQRTNQFNLTTVRRSEAEILGRCQGETRCLVVRVTDRFGDYGIVGVMIFEPLADALSVDTFLLSCRALGRRVEYRMLAALGQMARERGLSWVDLGYSRTQKNRPALDFLKDVAAPTEELGDGRVLRVSEEAAAALRHIPHSAEQARAAPSDEPVAAPAFAATRSSAWQHADRLRAIALTRYDVHQIQDAISAQARNRAALDGGRSGAAFVAPRTSLEQQLAAIFAAVLKVDRVGIHDSFFDLGGDSFLVVRVLAEIERTCGRRLSVATLFQAPTVEEIGQILAAGSAVDDSDMIVPLNPHGTTPPLFSVWMGIATNLRELSRCLGADQRMYGVSSYWNPGRISKTSIEEMAAHYLMLLRKVQPHGPYYLSGDCLVTLIALEMAQQLLGQGEQVAGLVLIDPLPPRTSTKMPPAASNGYGKIKQHLQILAKLNLNEQFSHLLHVLSVRWNKIAFRVCLACRLPLSRALLSSYVVDVHQRAESDYVPKTYAGKIWCIWAVDDMDEARRSEIQSAWSRLAAQATHRTVPGAHVALFDEPYVGTLAEQMKICLAEARRSAGRVRDRLVGDPVGSVD